MKFVVADLPLPEDPAMKAFGLKRLFLHAARFEFELGGKTFSFTAPLAPDLAGVLDVLPGDSAPQTRTDSPGDRSQSRPSAPTRNARSARGKSAR